MASIQKKNKRRLSELQRPTAVSAAVAEHIENINEAPAAPKGSPVTGIQMPAQQTVTVKEDKDTVKREKDKLKVDKDLLKEIKRLTDSMNLKPSDKKEQKGIRGWFNRKVEGIKSLGSVTGLARAAGIGSDPNSLLGSVVGGMEEKRDAKIAKRKEEAEFIANFQELSAAGRKLGGAGSMESFAEGRRRFKELGDVTDALTPLELKEKKAREFGGSISEKDAAQLEELRAKKTSLSDFGPEKKEAPAPVKPRMPEFLAGVNEGIRSELGSLTPEELSGIDPEMLKAALEGALAELRTLSEDQLEELEKIYTALKPSEESDFESKRKAAGIEVVPQKAAEAQKEEGGGGGSLLGGLLDRFGGKALGGIGKKALGSLGGVGKKLLPGLLGGAKSGASGLTKLLPAAKGLLGKLGPLAMAGMAVYDGVSGFNKANENLGIEGREATTGEKFSSAAGSIASGLTFGLLDSKTASRGIADFFGAGPTQQKVEKQKVTERQLQKERMAENKKVAKEIDASKEAKKTSEAPAVINAPTTNVNNNSTVVMPTVIRNNEPTYMNRMDRYVRP